MRIVSQRSALLSDFEVLQLLRETEEQQRAQAQEWRSKSGASPDDDNDAYTVPPNVRTVQFEAISSLSQPVRPCARQNPEQIRAFLEDIESSGFAPPDERILAGEPGLTKAERLQLVNHAPMSVVELHTLVEELGQRLTDEQIDQVLAIVSRHFVPADTTAPLLAPGQVEYAEEQMQQDEYPEEYIQDDGAAGEDAFPEEHFEHEQSTAQAADDDDE
ncbi:hypothetical protein MCUN1_000478 [Malassezia cuniculi]|uniref:DNA-directed RNA polymerase III subunit RPC9 n=1 Tax=Malassezia cuniculi TaxID=948313 RepID=A0AAF0ERB3_9BASI|nr:hypothetical protein MCUN1_000478 [Malassezia cuniculi]